MGPLHYGPPILTIDNRARCCLRRLLLKTEQNFKKTNSTYLSVKYIN